MTFYVEMNAVKGSLYSNAMEYVSEKELDDKRIYVRFTEELLPGIDDFLIDTLSKEKLSASTEKKRLYYVERLDVLRLPPTLPPRPDGLTKNGHSSSHPNINASTDDFIAQQRELAQEANGEEYDTVESPKNPLAGVLEKFGLNEEQNGCHEEELYEVPVGQHPSAFSDGEYSTGTDYESYSDDEDGPVYQNEEFHDTKSKSRGKSKRKDKRNSDRVPEYETVCAKDYPNASYAGELYQKWKLGKWMKRYCVLDRSGGFLCFKNDRETKPVHQIGNFEVNYVGKEGKKNYVLKLTPSYGEPLYFSGGENKEKSEKWMRALDPSFPGIDQAEASQGEETGRSTSNTNLSLSSSEGGSGDGVVHHGNPPLQQQNSQSDKNKKSMMDSISSFFSMGRKKGDKTKQQMNMADIEEKELDPDALVGGAINISSELFNHRRWLVRYCIIKDGNLMCFKENSEELEFTLPLHGLEIDSSRDTKRQLAVRLSQDARERVILDFSDALEQGSWLSVLVKEIGLGDQGGVLAYQAVNDAVSPSSFDDDADGDIYDEPYEDKGQNGLTRGRPGSDSVRSTSSNASTSSAGNPTDGSKVPPPLPAAPPPANREVGDYGEEIDVIYVYEGDDEENDENHNFQKITGIKTSDGVPITEQIYQNTCVFTNNDSSTTMTLTYSGSHGNDLETLQEEVQECEYQNVGYGREHLDYNADRFEKSPTKQVEQVKSKPEQTVSDKPVNKAGNIEVSVVKTSRKSEKPPREAASRTPTPRKTELKSKSNQKDSLQLQKDKKLHKVSPKLVKKEKCVKNEVVPSTDNLENSESVDEESAKWDEWMKESEHDKTVSKASEKHSEKDEKRSENDEKLSKDEKLSDNSEEASSPNTQEQTFSDIPGIVNSKEEEGESIEQDAAMYKVSQDLAAQEERVRRSHSGRGASTNVERSSVSGVRRSLTSATPQRTPSFNSQESSDTDSQSSDVIKCHQGPTINLDKDVLAQTENPILSQIRQNRTRISFRQSDKENLLDAIGNTRKKLATLRKKRAELRAKKLHCPDLRGKKDLEEQLKSLQDEYTVGEKELEELKEQLDEMENVFAAKAKSLDRGTTPPESTTERRRSGNLSSSSFEADRGSPRTRRSFTYRSEESQRRSSASSSPSPGKTSCTVQFSAGIPSSTIAIRDFSKSTTTSASSSRTVQESRVVVKTTSTSGSKVVTKTTTTTNSSSSSPEPYKKAQKIEIQGLKKGETDLPSPRGGRQKVQEKLKLWESLSTTSTC